MIRTELDRQLGDLRASVLLMGEGVVAATSRAMEALARQDQEAAGAVIAGDDRIDEECAAIEAMSARLITLQQPAIRDLRAVLAALAIAEELERIGDHAEGIARLVQRLPGAPEATTMLALTSLGALARVQLQSALDTYRTCDAARA